MKSGKTAKAGTGGRSGQAAGRAGVALRCFGTIQAIIGQAKHNGLLAKHPTQGPKKLTSKQRTRQLNVAEIEVLGWYPEDDGDPIHSGTELQALEQACLELRTACAARVKAVRKKLRLTQKEASRIIGARRPRFSEA